MTSLSRNFHVELVLDLLANFPNLTEEYVRACIAYASEIIGEGRVFPITGS